MNAVTNEAKAIAQVEDQLKTISSEVKSFIEKANGEISTNSKLSQETKSALETLTKKSTELADRLVELEQKGSKGSTEEIVETIGAQFVKANFKSLSGGLQKSARMELKAAIVNATGADQPLVPAHRQAGIMGPQLRRLTIRDLLPVGQTSSNMVEYGRELVFVNNAGPQGAEGSLKKESSITFELAKAAVETIAHWIPASRQVLDDAPMLESYLNTRMMYGLKLEEEDQLLNGSGANGEIAGILLAGNNQAKAFVLADGTVLDQIRKAITLAQLSEYHPDTIVIHPLDLELIELLKDDNGGYIWVNPNGTNGAQPWGLRAIVTTAIAAGTFLVGSFGMGAQIWDRQQAAIEVSRENSDNFVKNMVTILAEERLALTVYRPAAFVKGTFYKGA